MAIFLKDTKKFLHQFKTDHQKLPCNNKTIGNILFITAISGATVAPAISDLKLHHLILFPTLVAIAFLKKDALIKILRKNELVFLLSFLLIPVISGFFSGYLFLSLDAFKQQLLFCWTVITWVFFLKHQNQWSWNKILYLIILGDCFVLLYIFQASLRNNFYIGTTESSYCSVVALISALFYSYSKSNNNLKLYILVFNLFLSVIIFIFFSTSRGALLGILCGLLSFNFFITVAVFLIIIIGQYYFHPTFFYLNRFVEGINQISEQHGTAADRYILWGKIFRDAFDYPAGRGAGSYRTLIGNQFIEIAESLYFEILSAGGFLLLTFFIIFLFLLSYRVSKLNCKLMLFLVSAYILISTNPIGYHPIIPLYISIILFTALSKK